MKKEDVFLADSQLYFTGFYCEKFEIFTSILKDWNDTKKKTVEWIFQCYIWFTTVLIWNVRNISSEYYIWFHVQMSYFLAYREQLVRELGSLAKIKFNK